MNHFGYHPPIRPRNPYRPQDMHEMYPHEPLQNEALSAQNQTPTLQINVRFEKDAPETPIIEPSVQSVRALADWYRTNGITPRHIPISGARVGNTEIPPLYSQEQDFDEGAFRIWAAGILGGPSAVTLDKSPRPGMNWNNIELDILRKVYGNLGRIEQVRAIKEDKDIKKGTIKNLNKMRLDEKLREVIDERLGDPIEFAEDIQTINTMIDDEKEHGFLSEEAIDYLFGCVIHSHIMKPGFQLSVEDNQPVVKTGNTTLDAQWESKLATIHFGRKTGSPFSIADNQPKIADYIAAYAYHNVDKNLTGHFTTLSQKAIGNNPDTTLTAEVIEKSALTNEEKTFLTQWVGQESRLGDIQTRQRDFVERARENTRGKSWETIKRDFAKAPLSTMMQISPVAGLAVGAAIIWGLVRMMVGEGKLSKFFGATTAILGGFAIVGNIKTAEKLWGEAMGGNIADAVTQAPQKANIMSEMPEFFRDKWNNVSAYFSTSSDWSGLMLDERIGPKLADKYPTSAILAVLNPDPDNEWNEKYPPTTGQKGQINKVLEKLDDDEKEKLNVMLREMWDKYKNANKDELTNEQLKNGTMKTMVDSLDKEYSWFWARRGGYIFDREADRQALIEFTQNPKAWRELKIGDVMVEWFSNSDLADIPTNRIVSSEIQKFLSEVDGDQLEFVQITLKKIWEANAPCDPDKTLGELLAKED